jgi:uncharacterized membrane protein (DUF373 family)
MAYSSSNQILLERAELAIYLSTAVLLIGAAGCLLIIALIETATAMIAGDYVGGLLLFLDRALLVLMIAEIIYTVRRIAETHQLEILPFLMVAIIAAIRRILVITAESTRHFDIGDPIFRAAIVELGLLALIIVAVAAAMRIIPHHHIGAPN